MNLPITILGIAFIFLMTTAGAALVFLFKKPLSEKFNCIFMGFASGIMIAASIWSLLLPAIEGSESYGVFSFLPATVGFVVGGLFLVLLDTFTKAFKAKEGSENALSPPLKKLLFAVTMHNIPEGLAVGFAFGAAVTSGTQAAVFSALGLAVGIGIQNFPEGAAISLPVRAEVGRKRAFVCGALSGAVEPPFAVLGYFLASVGSVLQPWLLSFSAGAMIFVVAEELIPEAKNDSYPHLAAISVTVGFAVMMVLDVVLG